MSCWTAGYAWANQYGSGFVGGTNSVFFWMFIVLALSPFVTALGLTTINAILFIPLLIGVVALVVYTFREGGSLGLILVVFYGIGLYNIVVDPGLIVGRNLPVPKISIEKFESDLRKQGFSFDQEFYTDYHDIYLRQYNYYNLSITGDDAPGEARRIISSTLIVSHENEDGSITWYNVDATANYFYNRMLLSSIWGILGVPGRGWSEYFTFTPREFPGIMTVEGGRVVGISLADSGTTNESLTRMIESGDIPKDITTLSLNRNQINDVTPLTMLTQLAILGLNDNNINDITPLESLENLVALGIEGNHVNDITVLQHLSKLRFLWISDNQISDISSLRPLTQLERLYSNNNQIKDISALQTLTNLRFLQLNDNQINDIMALNQLVNLTNLQLNNNSIIDITPLAELDAKQRRNITPQQVADEIVFWVYEVLLGGLLEADPPQGPPRLVRLELDNNQISNITPLESLAELGTLHLNNNQISDVTPIGSLMELVDLQLNRNQISNITSLEPLVNLISLQLAENSINDITALSLLRELRFLLLSDNQINDITALGALTELIMLGLRNNQITDAMPLGSLTALETLFITDNPVSIDEEQMEKLQEVLPNSDIER